MRQILLGSLLFVLLSSSAWAGTRRYTIFQIGPREYMKDFEARCDRNAMEMKFRFDAADSGAKGRSSFTGRVRPDCEASEGGCDLTYFCDVEITDTDLVKFHWMIGATRKLKSGQCSVDVQTRLKNPLNLYVGVETWTTATFSKRCRTRSFAVEFPALKN